MNRTQENASLFERRRPLVPDAPEWFNRARDIANRRPVFRSLPDPPPPPSPRRARAESCIRFRGRPLVLVLSLVVLPLVFGIGFWTRGPSGSGEAAVAHSEPDAAVTKIAANNSGRDPGAKPADLASARGAMSAPPNEIENLDRHQHPVDLQTGEPGRDTLDWPPPDSAIVALPGDRADRNVALSPSFATNDDFAAGFSLKRPGQVRQISAEVLRPASPSV